MATALCLSDEQR